MDPLHERAMSIEINDGGVWLGIITVSSYPQRLSRLESYLTLFMGIIS